MNRGPVALALALALGSVSCAHTAQSAPGSQEPTPVTVLRVDNESVLDMDIFVVREVGDRLRIGFVNSHNTADLRIPPTFVFGATPLRFLADPVGGRGRSLSQEITVSPGDTVVMTIPR
ncbi:MAG TPA: hypothetical protein VF832_14140 [Longimicrobiales bacterium]